MRRGKASEVICKSCNESFKALDIKIRSGGGKFCSRACYNNFRKENAQCEAFLRFKHRIKCLYGLEYEDYERMLAEQNNKCGVCHRDMEVPFVDHCHITGDVRGLLCNTCNAGIGMLGDDIELLKSAISHLIASKG